MGAELSKWETVEFLKAVEIFDNLRKPINNSERQHRIENKMPDELFPYYGATGLVGYIDNYITDGEYVLLGEDGAPFLYPYANKSYIIQGKTWVNNHAHVLKSKFNNKFLCYYLNYFDYHGYVSGTTRLKLTQSDMKRMRIINPPIPEQEKIVAKLDALFSELDNGVAELKKIKEQLKIYRQAVLKEAFEGDYKSILFGAAGMAKLGKMLDKQKNNGNYFPYLRNINVRWFSFEIEDLLEMRFENSEHERFLIKRGDLVICEGGEPGRCAVWEQSNDIYYQKALHRVRFSNNHNPKFYMYYLWLLAQTDELRKYFTGTGIKHLTGESLKKIIVPCCSITQQQKIITEIESRLSVCDKIEEIVNEQLKKSASLRQSILKRAFEGKLV